MCVCMLQLHGGRGHRRHGDACVDAISAQVPARTVPGGAGDGAGVEGLHIAGELQKKGVKTKKQT